MEILEEELYMGIVAMVAYTVLSLVSLKVYTTDKGKTMLFYSLSWICNTVYLIVEMIGFILLNPIIWKLSYVILSISFLLWMLFIDYAFTDGISWKRFTIGAVYCAIFMFWAFMPGNIVTITSAMQPDGNLLYIYTMPSELLYIILFDLYAVLYASTFLYWNIDTLKAIPKDKKKEAVTMLIAGISLVAVSVLFFFADLKIIVDVGEIISTISYVLFLFSSVLSTIIIYKFPKITHLLPYRVYRLIIMGKSGTPYFEYKWTDEEVNTILLSGLFSAIGSISKSITSDFKTGHVRSVDLDNVSFLMEPQYSPITVGLIATKVSMDLKNSLKEFTIEFIGKYKDVLYNDDGLPNEIIGDPNNIFIGEDVVAMVDKHFQNVPKYIEEGLSTEELTENINARELERTRSPDLVGM